MSARQQPRGLLLDLDGTVYEDDAPIPGAPEAIAALPPTPDTGLTDAGARSSSIP